MVDSVVSTVQEGQLYKTDQLFSLLFPGQTFALPFCGKLCAPKLLHTTVI